MDAEDASLLNAEAARVYMDGRPRETGQFDFIIGEWRTAVTRFGAGNAEPRSLGAWRARYLHEGRMILDEFHTYAPGGREVSYMATLRTFNPTAQQWEMTFLAAHQPQFLTRFQGHAIGGEMRLSGIAAESGAHVAVRFFDITERSFEWEDEISLDGGRTWRKQTRISAQRGGVGPGSADRSAAQPEP